MIKGLVSDEVFRFIIAGGLNTLLTYLAYLFFLVFVTYQVAYSISFVLGVALGYTLNTLIVFRKAWAWKKLMQFPAVYLVQYLLGLIIISILVGYFSINEKIAPLLNVILLLPMTFIMSKWLITKPS